MVGEVDKLVVSLVAGTTYTVEMLGMSSLGTAGSLGRPIASHARSRAAALTLSRRRRQSAPGSMPRCTFTAATSGNYTFELSGDRVALTGAYTLQAAVVGGDAMTPATFMSSTAPRPE